MDHRQKLVELRDYYRTRANNMIPHEYSARGLEYKYLKMDNEAAGLMEAADDLDAILADWPEDAKVMPRELSTTAASVAGEVYTNCSHCDRETMIGWASKEVWRKGFDAYNPEDER